MANISPQLQPIDSTGSPDRFGYEWSIYSQPLPEHEEQFLRWTAVLPKSNWRGMRFLDVGCGMGRNSIWPMRYGAEGGVAVDVDEASLAMAKRNFGAYPKLKVRKLSAYALDYSDEFDIAFSIGVIHHLEQPARALANMVKAVRPGGRVLIWVYGLENNEWIVHWFNPLRKLIFSRLPIRGLHHLSLYPALLLWCALRLGLNRLEYFRLLRQFGFSHLRSIVFDQMLPTIANYWSEDEVRDLMRSSGLENVEMVWVNEMSWSAMGKKPLSSSVPGS